MELLKWLPSGLTKSKFLLNKYVITTMVFIVWLFVFDNHNFLTQRKLTHTINKLKAEEARYMDLIEQVKVEKVELDKNKEKYAREHFYLHKENEEVFIFERKEKK